MKNGEKKVDQRSAPNDFSGLTDHLLKDPQPVAKQKTPQTLEGVILNHFPTRTDQFWGYDVWGMDWDDNTVAATVRFVRKGKASDYLIEADAVTAPPTPDLDIYSVRVHCTFTKVEVGKNGLPRKKKGKQT